MQSTKHPHRPPHVYKDNTMYFITSRTLKSTNYFDTDVKKNIVVRSLNNALSTFNYSLFAYVILSNHFHLLINVDIGRKLPNFISSIKGKSTIEINKLDNDPGRQIWYQYWDRCIRSEKDFFARFNYIHHNPIKHKLYIHQKDISNYKFCSYGDWIDMKGKKWILNCFENYPTLDYTLPNSRTSSAKP